MHDLTRGDLAAAASSNLLLVVAIPVVVALWGRRVALLARGPAAPLAPRVPRALWWVLGAVVAAFTVLRNTPLPPGPWLAS